MLRVAETKQQTKPKTTRKSTTTKKATTKKEVVEKVVEPVIQEQPSQPTIDLSTLSPELIAQFMQLLALQQQGGVAPVQTTVAPTGEVKKDKRWLKTIKDREVRLTSCVGRVVYKSKKTGDVYKWLSTGDDDYFTVEELLSMDNQSPKFLRTPFLLIDDEEVVEALGLTELYKYIERVQDLETFFDLPLDDIIETCENLPKSFRTSLASVVNKKVEEQELRDIRVIRKLEELLDKDFNY